MGIVDADGGCVNVMDVGRGGFVSKADLRRMGWGKS